MSVKLRLPRGEVIQNHWSRTWGGWNWDPKILAAGLVLHLLSHMASPFTEHTRGQGKYKSCTRGLGKARGKLHLLPRIRNRAFVPVFSLCPQLPVPTTVFLSTQTWATCRFLGRIRWPSGILGPSGSSKCSCLWAIGCYDPHSAGVRGAHREPCLRERSHLRNGLIFAITEGFDKYIPRVSTIFYDTAHTLEAQWQGHIEKQSGVPSAHRCQAHPLCPAS